MTLDNKVLKFIGWCIVVFGVVQGSWLITCLGIVIVMETRWKYQSLLKGRSQTVLPPATNIPGLIRVGRRHTVCGVIMGKTKEWNDARKKLKKIYESKGITSCELRFPYCSGSSFLSFAHRYKRNDPRCESTFKGTLLACISCHQQIEYDRSLTREMFRKLRQST